MKKITALIVMGLMLGVIIVPALVAVPVKADDEVQYEKYDYTEYKIRYNATAATYIDHGYPDSNFGSSNIVRIGDMPSERKTYLMFNITKPAFSKIMIKKIDLYMAYVGQAYLSYNGVSKIGYTREKWNESTITWNNAPTDISYIPNVYYHPGRPVYVYVHLTDDMSIDYFTNYMSTYIMQDWKRYSNATFTLVLEKDHAIGGSYMGSKDYCSDESGSKPYIVITYNIYPKVYYYKTKIYASRDTWIDEAHKSWVYGHNDILRVGYIDFKEQRALINFEKNTILQDIFLNCTIVDVKLVIYPIQQNTALNDVVSITYAKYYQINEDVTCWDSRPTATEIYIVDFQKTEIENTIYHTAESDILTQTVKDHFKNYVGILLEIRSHFASGNYVDYASREYLITHNDNRTPYLEIEFTTKKKLFILEPEKPDFSKVDIGHIITTGCWLFGLLGMFASIPLVVYRIKNGDDEIQAITLGLAVFAISVGLFFAGGAPL